MNVLHITISFNRGGRREAIAALCNGLADYGVDNYLCCLDAFDCSASERANWFVDSIELHRRHLLDRQALRRLRAYCDEHAIDIVHAHDAASQAAGMLALHRRQPPMLMTFHRTRNFESARPRDRLRNALAGLRVGAVVTASEERRRHYLSNNHVRTAKVLCIPLGIDLLRFRPDAQRRAAKRAELGIGEGQMLVGAVGHFGPEKGIDLAIDAFQKFCDRHPHVPARLVVLGTGLSEHEQHVRARVEPRFADRIRFVGFQDVPETWFPAFDLLLHGARDEAFGLVLAEAMACGVPVVAAKVGGIPEVVEDGHSAQLADAPEVEALAAALEKALTTPGWLAAASNSALLRARERFDGKLYARKYFELYSELSGAPRSA